MIKPGAVQIKIMQAVGMQGARKIKKKYSVHRPCAIGRPNDFGRGRNAEDKKDHNMWANALHWVIEDGKASTFRADTALLRSYLQTSRHRYGVGDYGLGASGEKAGIVAVH